MTFETCFQTQSAFVLPIIIRIISKSIESTLIASHNQVRLLFQCQCVVFVIIFIRISIFTSRYPCSFLLLISLFLSLSLSLSLSFSAIISSFLDFTLFFDTLFPNQIYNRFPFHKLFDAQFNRPMFANSVTHTNIQTHTHSNRKRTEFEFKSWQFATIKNENVHIFNRTTSLSSAELLFNIFTISVRFTIQFFFLSDYAHAIWLVRKKISQN